MENSGDTSTERPRRAVDCDEAPCLESCMSLISNKKLGMLWFNFQDLAFKSSKKTWWYKVYDLAGKMLFKKKVNVKLLTDILEHKEEIPEDWASYVTIFSGTEVCDEENEIRLYPALEKLDDWQKIYVNAESVIGSNYRVAYIPRKRFLENRIK